MLPNEIVKFLLYFCSAFFVDIDNDLEHVLQNLCLSPRWRILEVDSIEYLFELVIKTIEGLLELCDKHMLVLLLFFGVLHENLVNALVKIVKRIAYLHLILALLFCIGMQVGAHANCLESCHTSPSLH